MLHNTINKRRKADHFLQAFCCLLTPSSPTYGPNRALKQYFYFLLAALSSLSTQSLIVYERFSDQKLFSLTGGGAVGPKKIHISKILSYTRRRSRLCETWAEFFCSLKRTRVLYLNGRRFQHFFLHSLQKKNHYNPLNGVKMSKSQRKNIFPVDGEEKKCKYNSRREKISSRHDHTNKANKFHNRMKIRSGSTPTPSWLIDNLGNTLDDR